MLESLSIDTLKAFAALGIMVFILVVILLFIGLVYSIREKIQLLMKKYHDRHKFEKPPTAKCYCVACGMWRKHPNSEDIGWCNAWRDYCTSENEFCSRGYLRTDEEYKQ